jgi:hypothetical protein
VKPDEMDVTVVLRDQHRQIRRVLGLEVGLAKELAPGRRLRKVPDLYIVMRCNKPAG